MMVVPNSLSLVGFLFIVSAAIFVPSCMGAAGDNVLYQGQTLKAAEALVSGIYSLVMEDNCNLVIYNDTTELWSTGTAGKGKGGKCYVKLHKDGNLALYSSTAHKLWESNSSSTRLGNMAYVFQLQKDGNAAIYGKSGFCFSYWGATCIFDFKQLTLISTEPTKLIVGAGAEQNNVLFPWETLKIGESLVSHNKRLTMEKDCKLVMYDSKKIVLNLDFGYKGYTGCHLKSEVHGNVAIFDSDGRRVWGTSYFDLPIGNYIFILWSDGMIGTIGPDRWMTHRDGLTRMPSEKTSMVKNE